MTGSPAFLHCTKSSAILVLAVQGDLCSLSYAQCFIFIIMFIFSDAKLVEPSWQMNWTFPESCCHPPGCRADKLCRYWLFQPLPAVPSLCWAFFRRVSCCSPEPFLLWEPILAGLGARQSHTLERVVLVDDSMPQYVKRVLA